MRRLLVCIGILCALVSAHAIARDDLGVQFGFVPGIQAKGDRVSEAYRVFKETLTDMGYGEFKTYSFANEANGIMRDNVELFVLKCHENGYAKQLDKMLKTGVRTEILSDVSLAMMLYEGCGDTKDQESVLAPVLKVARLIVAQTERVALRGHAMVFVAHSQGNLIVNLAYMAYVQKHGKSAADKDMVIVNVANTSLFSVQGHEFNNRNDEALALLEQLPKLVAQGRLGVAFPRSLHNSPLACMACSFKTRRTASNAKEIQISKKDLLEHSFSEVYLSKERMLIGDEESVTARIHFQRLLWELPLTHLNETGKGVLYEGLKKHQSEVIKQSLQHDCGKPPCSVRKALAVTLEVTTPVATPTKKISAVPDVASLVIKLGETKDGWSLQNDGGIMYQGRRVTTTGYPKDTELRLSKGNRTFRYAAVFDIDRGVTQAIIWNDVTKKVVALSSVNSRILSDSIFWSPEGGRAVIADNAEVNEGAYSFDFTKTPAQVTRHRFPVVLKECEGVQFYNNPAHWQSDGSFSIVANVYEYNTGDPEIDAVERRKCKGNARTEKFDILFR